MRSSASLNKVAMRRLSRARCSQSTSSREALLVAEAAHLGVLLLRLKRGSHRAEPKRVGMRTFGWRMGVYGRLGSVAARVRSDAKALVHDDRGRAQADVDHLTVDLVRHGVVAPVGFDAVVLVHGRTQPFGADEWRVSQRLERGLLQFLEQLAPRLAAEPLIGPRGQLVEQHADAVVEHGQRECLVAQRARI
jgi:hypothetical protein